MADNIARAMAKQAKDMANGMLQDIDDRFTQLTTQQQQDAEVIEARNGKASLKERLDGIDSVSASKANEVDLVVERERINLIEANPGSTSGDLALNDIKIGADGKVYNSPGDAVRSQISDIENIVSDKYEIEVNGLTLISTTKNEFGIIRSGRIYDAIASDNAVKCYCYYLNDGGKFRATNLSNSINNTSRLYAAYSGIEGTVDQLITEYSGARLASGSTITDTGILEFPQSVKMVAFSHANADLTQIGITKYDFEFGDSSLVVRVNNLESGLNYNKIGVISEQTERTYSVERFYSERATNREKYASAESKTLYVSSINGSDSNDGLSQITPLATVNAAALLLNNGDALLIEKGSVFKTSQRISNKNGLLIDVYGDHSVDNPLFSNFYNVPSVEIEKVAGYNNIYKINRNYAQSVGNRSVIQVFVDGNRCGWWVNYTAITTTADALLYLENNPNNAAWCSCYDNGGWASGWNAGKYIVYFSLSDSPLNHTIEITSEITTAFVLDNCNDIDCRHVTSEGNSSTDGWGIPSGYFEDVKNVNFARHGFLFSDVKMLNCAAISLSGANGYHFHSIWENKKYNDLIFVGCKAIGKHGLSGTGFAGHKTDALASDIVYNNLIITDCYCEGMNSVVSSAGAFRRIIENLVIKDVTSLGYGTNTVINGVVGTLKQTGEKKALIAPPLIGTECILRDCKLKVTSVDGGSYLLYTDSMDQFGTLNIIRCAIMTDVIQNVQTGYFKDRYIFANAVVNVKDSVIANNNKDEKLIYEVRVTSIPRFENSVMFGISNNAVSSELIDTIFEPSVNFITKPEYLMRWMYTSGNTICLMRY